MKSKLLRAATLVAATASILASVQAQPTKPAARTIVEEIKKQVGVEWKQDTVDTFKAGNPDTPVTGIAVTMMATMDVLERAAAKGLNLVITHVFYAHVDTPDGLLENDPVWSEKRAFIERHNMVIWRFHDHWHMRHPDGIEAGVVHTLPCERFQNPENQYLFVIPETTLRKLAQQVAAKLQSPVVRVVGDPEMKVTQVGLQVFNVRLVHSSAKTCKRCWSGKLASGRRSSTSPTP